jgi:hypothetical protein
LILLAAAAARGESRRVVFDRPGIEQSWPANAFDLPTDWSGSSFLVLELRLSSPQRFDLRVHDASGVRSVRLSPVPGAWIRSVVPIAFLTEQARQGNDLAAVHNKPRPMMFINLSGTPGPLTAVKEIGVVMANPTGSPSLEIRAIRVSKDDPGDALLESKPLVDEFGQWVYDDWPGKAKSLQQLKAVWTDEDKSLGSGDFDYCRYGGYRSLKAKGSGFFRVEKIDGRWWLVDPDGHLFFSAGSDCITPMAATPTQGREQLFAALPPAELSRGGRGGSSFYTWNLVRRFGADWAQPWIDLTARRMFAWGFNTVGNWSDPRMGAAHRVPYVFTTRGWGIESGPMGVPDVYAPTFANAVDRAAAQQCDSHKDDPYPARLFPRQRAALARPRIRCGRCHSCGRTERAPAGTQDVSRRGRHARTPQGVPRAHVHTIRRHRFRGGKEARSQSPQPGSPLRLLGAARNREGFEALRRVQSE